MWRLLIVFVGILFIDVCLESVGIFVPAALKFILIAVLSAVWIALSEKRPQNKGQGSTEAINKNTQLNPQVSGIINHNGQASSEEIKALNIETRSFNDTEILHNNNKSNSSLKGIGGLLILVLIGLILSSIGTLIALDDLFSLYQPDVWYEMTTYGSPVYHPLLAPLIIFETLVNAFFCLFSITMIILMFIKSRFFPKLMILGLTIVLLIEVIDLFLASVVFSDLPSNVTDGLLTIDSLIISIMNAVIWIPYFLKSKRVKATFLSKTT